MLKAARCRSAALLIAKKDRGKTGQALSHVWKKGPVGSSSALVPGREIGEINDRIGVAINVVTRAINTIIVKIVALITPS
jgi:hypothetical protein